MKIVEMGAGDDFLADGLALWISKWHEHATSSFNRHAHGFHQVTLLLSNAGRAEWQVGDDCAFSGLATGHVVVCRRTRSARGRLKAGCGLPSHGSRDSERPWSPTAFRTLGVFRQVTTRRTAAP